MDRLRSAKAEFEHVCMEAGGCLRARKNQMRLSLCSATIPPFPRFLTLERFEYGDRSYMLADHDWFLQGMSSATRCGVDDATQEHVPTCT